MVDVFDKDKRSQIMQKVKSQCNKSTELKLISIFPANGIRGWRRHYPDKGHLDFVFLKEKMAVWVDGYIWRGHDCRNTRPLDHQEYWQKKHERNIKRDQKVTAVFDARGWVVLRIWKCELKRKYIKELLKRLQLALNNERLSETNL